jgi:hypothetical protein
MSSSRGRYAWTCTTRAGGHGGWGPSLTPYSARTIPPRITAISSNLSCWTPTGRPIPNSWGRSRITAIYHAPHVAIHHHQFLEDALIQKFSRWRATQGVQESNLASEWPQHSGCTCGLSSDRCATPWPRTRRCLLGSELPSCEDSAPADSKSEISRRVHHHIAVALELIHRPTSCYLSSHLQSLSSRACHLKVPRHPRDLEHPPEVRLGMHQRNLLLLEGAGGDPSATDRTDKSPFR